MSTRASLGRPPSASRSDASSDTTATSTSEANSASVTQAEVRIALVMYGGVSLAIYMNGIAQELFHMVRATATKGDGNPSPLFGYSSLSKSERVYRKLSYILAGAEDFEEQLIQNRDIPRRFIIDVISGTSAGGINGIFLAKALANGQKTLDSLEELWVEEGDFDRLINDKRSVEGSLSPQWPPLSLLNSQRMYCKLFDALEAMDDSEKHGAYIDELDLFVTTTDIEGLPVPLRLSDAVVHERRHRSVLRFAYSKEKADDESNIWNDFKPINNPFLAYAARCTSAFPFAFEAMQLGDIDKVLNTTSTGKAYLRNYGKYLGDKGVAESAHWRRFFEDYLIPMDESPIDEVPFHQRSFGDGGYLDNKPFTYATEMLAHRRADVPVDRKLIYIEPSPDQPEMAKKRARKPDAFENSMAALMKLPRYETIREDLEQILSRNRLIERVNSIIRGVESGVARVTAHSEKGIGYATLWNKELPTNDEWGELDLADMIRREGPGYAAYHRLVVMEVTDGLAKLIAHIAAFNEDSDYFLVTGSLVRAWRDKNYAEYRQDGDNKKTRNNFLQGFDLSYPMRRLNFLRSRIDRFYNLDDEDRETIGAYIKAPWPNDIGEQHKWLAENSAWLVAFRDELLKVKRELNNAHATLRSVVRKLSSRPPTGAVRPRQTRITGCSSSLNQGSTQELAAGMGAADAVKTLQQKTHSLVKAISDAASKENPESDSPILDYFLGAGKRITNGYKDAIAVHTDTARILIGCNDRAKKLMSTKHICDLLNDLGNCIEEQIRPTKDQTDAQCRKQLSDDPSISVGARDARRVLLHYYGDYIKYDMIIFPIRHETRIGEADEVEILRISAEDADYLIPEKEIRRKKLAGTWLGNFGAFLEKRWRINDILWGRLDGAERIIEALLPGSSEEMEKLKEKIIGEAQAEIVLETIAKMGSTELKDVLVEPFVRLEETKGQRALTQFIEKLKQHATSEQKEALDERFDLGTVKDHYREVVKERRGPEPRHAMEIAARATTVVGEMLAAISSDHDIPNKYASWMARIGRVSWALIEIAVPRSLPNLIFLHWLKLLYTFEVALFFGSALLAHPAVQRFAFAALFTTFTLHLIILLLGDYIARKNTWLRLTMYFFIASVFVMLVLGLITFLAIIGINDWWRQCLTKPNEGLPGCWMFNWRVWLASVAFLFVVLSLGVIRENAVARRKPTTAWFKEKAAQFKWGRR